MAVSTHSRPKAADLLQAVRFGRTYVSTHSRPKAAEPQACQQFIAHKGFNTQPPEGG
mgnify:CR=1 FL=1